MNDDFLQTLATILRPGKRSKERSERGCPEETELEAYYEAVRASGPGEKLSANLEQIGSHAYGCVECYPRLLERLKSHTQLELESTRVRLYRKAIAVILKKFDGFWSQETPQETLQQPAAQAAYAGAVGDSVIVEVIDPSGETRLATVTADQNRIRITFEPIVLGWRWELWATTPDGKAVKPIDRGTITAALQQEADTSSIRKAVQRAGKGAHLEIRLDPAKPSRRKR